VIDPGSDLAEIHAETANDPTSWAWDFGDGGSSSAQDPEHTYQTGGTFTVTLTVSNDIGSDTLILPGLITVEEAERIYLPLVMRNVP
jgi:PKD repeat protein